MKDPLTLRTFLIHSRNLFALLLFALVALGAALALSACRSASGLDQTFSPGVSGFNAETNLLREGDLVSISFQNSTNLNTTQKIPLDGLLNLENVGTVKAAGKTPEIFQAELARLYGPQTRNDPITVKLIAGATAVYVSGAVSHPGRVPMERPMTALEAVMEAGGFDPARARLSAVTVLRIAEGHQKTFHIDLKRVLAGLDDSPFYLKPFDIVHVPSRTFNF